jgi:alkylhydroperoxidase family enzyme
MAERYPRADVPPDIAAHIAAMGGRPLNLYRVLANAPAMLKAWIDFAYSIRHDCKTPRRLRELMILRTAQLHRSAYEWHQHSIMAREAAVPERQIAELSHWRTSDAFEPCEKAALAFTEAMVAGDVNDAVHAAIAQHFSPAECVELATTAGFYCMVPRVLSALAVTADGEPAANSGAEIKFSE